MRDEAYERQVMRDEFDCQTLSSSARYSQLIECPLTLSSRKLIAYTVVQPPSV